MPTQREWKLRFSTKQRVYAVYTTDRGRASSDLNMFTFLFCLSGYDRRWARQNASWIADGVWLLRNRWFSPYRLDEHNETCLPVDHNPSWKSIQFALAWKMPCLRRNSLLLLPAVRCRTTYRQEWAGCRSCWLRFESIDQSAALQRSQFNRFGLVASLDLVQDGGSLRNVALYRALKNKRI